MMVRGGWETEEKSFVQVVTPKKLEVIKENHHLNIEDVFYDHTRTKIPLIQSHQNVVHGLHLLDE